MAELDRAALTSANYAFLNSHQDTDAGRVEDAIVAYLHALDYATENRSSIPGLWVKYPSGVATLAAVAAHRTTDCPGCAQRVRDYGGGQCESCWKRDHPRGVRFTMPEAGINPDAVRGLFGDDTTGLGEGRG